jgi:hypothetical protein
MARAVVAVVVDALGPLSGLDGVPLLMINFHQPTALVTL